MGFLKRMAQRSEEQARLEGLSNKAFHSRFYHDQYEGYSERYVLQKNGKKKIERIYTGSYYQPEQTDKQVRASNLLRVVLFVVGVTLFLVGASRTAACNFTVYVTALQAVSVVFLFWLLMGLLSRLTVSGPLKQPDYKHAVVRTARASLLSCIGLFAAAAAALAAAFLAGEGFDRPSVLCAVLFLAAGAVFLGWNRFEAAIKYRVIDNSAPEPEGSIQL